MAQDSVSVDELLVSLGLDVSQIDKDFVDVDKTVKQNIARMRAEKNRISIQMDIDTAKLGPAASMADKLAVKEAALSQQLKIQQQIVALSNAAYAKLIQDKGNTAAASSNLHTALLKEQRALADINNQMQAAGAQKSGGLNSLFAGVGDQLKSGNLKGAITSVGGNFTSMAGVSVKALGLIGIAVGTVTATVKILADAALYGAQAGESLYQLSTRLHISSKEAAQLNGILRLGNVDAGAFTSTMMRLEKSVGGTSTKSQETAKALAEFGVKLTDDNGKLLPMNQQLEKLAQGYQEAAKSGNEEAYVSQVLGTRGRELIPIIQQYGDIKAAVSRIHPIGDTDIKSAHEVTQSVKVLEMQWGKIKSAAAGALVPLANMILPSLVDGLNLCIDGVRTLKSAFDSVADGSRLFRNMIFNFTDTPLSQLYDKSKKQLEEQKQAEKDAEAAKIAAAKKAEEETEKITAEEKKSQDEVMKEVKRRIEETKQARISAQEETFKATHTEIANEIYDIDKKAAELKQKDVEAVYIEQYTQAAKNKVVQDYLTNTVDKMNEAYNTALQNRLSQIEKEKNAWKQKGVDEVAATKWAEEQKLSAVRNAALEAIKSDKKRLDEVRGAMSRQTTGYGIDANGNKVQFNFKTEDTLQQLSQKWLSEDRAKLGIRPGETFSPELMSAYAEIKKYTEGQLVPGLESKIPLGGASGTKVINNSPAITVNIDRAMVKDQGMIDQIADEVSTRIEERIDQKLMAGGVGNGY